MLDDSASPALRRLLRRVAQPGYLLDQVLQIQLVVATGAQALGLAPGPDVEVVLIETFAGWFDPRRHANSQCFELLEATRG